MEPKKLIEQARKQDVVFLAGLSVELILKMSSHTDTLGNVPNILRYSVLHYVDNRLQCRGYTGFSNNEE